MRFTPDDSVIERYQQNERLYGLFTPRRLQEELGIVTSRPQERPAFRELPSYAQTRIYANIVFRGGASLIEAASLESEFARFSHDERKNVLVEIARLETVRGAFQRIFSTAAPHSEYIH